jgi:hypothetical protein
LLWLVPLDGHDLLFLQVDSLSFPLVQILPVTSLVSTGWAQSYQADITATANWMASSSVTLSDGAVLSGANSTEINPYFANLGVHGFAEDSTYYNNIDNYMTWFWNNVGWPLYFNSTGCTTAQTATDLYGAIPDFSVSGGVVTAECNALHPDSTDSYAGTFLSLAYADWQTGNASAQSYIESITGTGGDHLDYEGEVVLGTLQSNNLTWAKPLYNIQYLEDNSEAYRGLQDLVSLYTALYNKTNDSAYETKASFYSPYAQDMQSAITTTLWDSATNGNDFYSYTTNGGQGSPVAWSTWYGTNGAVSEVFPIALGVISPTSTQAKDVWNTFQSNWKSQWVSLNADPSGYPWVIVGYTAALMGDTADANTFIKNIETQFVNTNFNGCVTENGQQVCKNWSVNEAGYFMRLCALMK